MAEEQVFLNPEEHDAFMEDFSEVVTGVVGKVIALADKHNVDRDNAMMHFSQIFSAMVNVSTFKHYGEGDGE